MAVRRTDKSLFVFGGKETHAYSGAYHRDSRGDLWQIALDCPSLRPLEPNPAAASAGTWPSPPPAGSDGPPVPPAPPPADWMAVAGRAGDSAGELPPGKLGAMDAELASASAAPPPSPPLPSLFDIVQALPRALMPASLAIRATV